MLHCAVLCCTVCFLDLLANEEVFFCFFFFHIRSADLDYKQNYVYYINKVHIISMNSLWISGYTTTSKHVHSLSKLFN